MLQNHILGLLNSAQTHATLALAAAEGGYQSRSTASLGYV